MHQVFHRDYDTREVVCGKCGWKGEAGALIRGEYLYLTDAIELHCPRCRNYLGFLDLGDAPEGQEREDPG